MAPSCLFTHSKDGSSLSASVCAEIDPDGVEISATADSSKFRWNHPVVTHRYEGQLAKFRGGLIEVNETERDERESLATKDGGSCSKLVDIVLDEGFSAPCKVSTLSDLDYPLRSSAGDFFGSEWIPRPSGPGDVLFCIFGSFRKWAGLRGSQVKRGVYCGSSLLSQSSAPKGRFNRGSSEKP